MNRRECLVTISATLSGVALAGCSGNSGEENSDVTAEWNSKEYDRVRFPSQDEGVFFESDSETQYVGVQLKATNETSESLALVYDEYITVPEITLFADNSNEDVSLHGQSKVSPLENVGGGETVETTLLYTVPPDVSSYAIKTREQSEHTYSINKSDNLEIGLIQLSN
jgi:hypothetical protein